MRILLKLKDGVEFLTSESQFTAIHYPEHKHKDTEFMVPEQFVLHCQIGKIAISALTFKAMQKTDANDVLIVSEAEAIPEWQLCGYATREEFDTEKSEILERKKKKEEDDKAFLEKLRKDREIKKQKNEARKKRNGKK